MARLSVVIPTHDRTRLLMTRSLPSVLAQETELQMDVLVVGDDTEPGTAIALQGFDPRVRFVNLPRQAYPEDPGQRWCVLGLEARNYGYDNVDGDYLYELDDDDAVLPGAIQHLYERLVGADADLSYGRSKLFHKDGSIGWHGAWPPQHFAYCEGAWLSKHDLGYRYDPACIERGLPMDGDRIDRMVAGGVRFTHTDQIVHYYWPNPR